MLRGWSPFFSMLRLIRGALFTPFTSNKLVSVHYPKHLLCLMRIAAIASLLLPVWVHAETVDSRQPGWTSKQLLQQIVGIALLRSPGLHESEAQWHASTMDTEEARSGRWPRVELTGSSAARQFGAANPYGNGTTGRAGVVLAYTLFDGGKTRDLIQSKQFSEEAAHAKYQMAREQVLFDTTHAFFQILKYQSLIRYDQAHIARLEMLVQKMTGIVQGIPGRRSELTQTQARLLQAVDNKVAAEAKLREYRIQLAKLIGNENMPPLDDVSLPGIDLLSPQDALEQARHSHPILSATEADRQALTLSAKSVRDGHWPALELQVTRMSGVDIMGYPDPGQTFLYFKWNAFQGFAAAAQEKALLARANAADEKHRQALLDIEYKLNSAWADYQNQTARVAGLQALVSNTERVRDDYYEQWEQLGRRTLLEVLTAENEHLNTLSSLLSSEFDRHIALARLRFESATLANWLATEDSAGAEASH